MFGSEDEEEWQCICNGPALEREREARELECIQEVRELECIQEVRERGRRRARAPTPVPREGRREMALVRLGERVRIIGMRTESLLDLDIVPKPCIRFPPPVIPSMPAFLNWGRSPTGNTA